MKADVRLYKTMGLEDEGQWRQKSYDELGGVKKRLYSSINHWIA
jgi:hypothetical protein